jgi:hypothetical protein
MSPSLEYVLGGQGYYWIVFGAKRNCTSKIIMILPLYIWYKFKYVKNERQNVTDIII